MICVLAANYVQYMEWCRETGLHPQREAYYCESRLRMMGLTFEEFTKVGQYWEASDEAKLAFAHAQAYYKVRDGIRVT